MPKHWKPNEITIACKSYIAATLNPVKGADQNFVAFSTDLIQKMTVISPPNCDDETYWKRGINVYLYLRDNVFSRRTEAPESVEDFPPPILLQ